MALKRDDFEVTLKNGWLCLAWALEGCAGEIAHDTKDETREVLFNSQLFKAEAYITAWSELQRQ